MATIEVRTWRGRMLPREQKVLHSCLDPDAPGGAFVHWFVCNIPATVTEFAAGTVPAGVTELENGAGRTGYIGPCPPSGTHRYFFTAYALDVDCLDTVTPQNFLEIVTAHSLVTAECVGLYKRP